MHFYTWQAWRHSLFYSYVLRARPAGSGVPEVGIGSRESDGGIAYISGRRLACEPLVGTPRFSTRCALLIDGDLLVIKAGATFDSARAFAGLCEATFRGQRYDCQPGLRRGTVRTIALIEEPLGLAPAELEALRRQYWVENDRFPSVHLIALLTALVAVAGVAAWKPPGELQRRGTWLAYPLVAGFAFVLTSILLFGLTAFLWS